MQQALRLVETRASGVVGPDQAKSTAAELRGLVEEWDRMKEADLAQSGKFPWSRRGYFGKPADDDRWLIDKQKDLDRRGAFVAPDSLREIESEVNVVLLGTPRSAV